MSLKRDIIKHTTVYSAARILEKAVGFLLLPLYAHIFQTEGYGVIGMVDASISLLTVAFAYGFHHAIVRIYHDEPEPHRRAVVSTAVVLVAGLGMALVPPLLIVSPWLSTLLLGSPQYTTILNIAVITVIVTLIGRAASTDLIIQQRSLLYSAVGILHVILGIVLNIVLVLVLEWGLNGIFIASLITNVVGTAIFLFAALRDLGFHFDRRLASKLIAFQGPLVPAEILSFFSRQAERFLVRFQLGLSSVGILEMAYKFPPMITMFFVSPFMLAWRTRSMALAADPDAPNVIGRFLTYFAFVLLGIALVFAVSMGPLLRLLTPESFWGAAPIARVEVVTTVLFGFVTFMEFGLLYTQRTARLAVLKSGVAVVKVCVSVVLISRFGLAGAAYSAALMELVSLVWVARLSQRAFPIHIEWTRLATLVVTAVGVYLLVGWIEALPNRPSRGWRHGSRR